MGGVEQPSPSNRLHAALRRVVNDSTVVFCKSQSYREIDAPGKYTGGTCCDEFTGEIMAKLSKVYTFATAVAMNDYSSLV